VGRYLYAQIPRSLNAAELTLKELQQMEDRLAAQLSAQGSVSPLQLQRVLQVPTPAEVGKMPLARALLAMIALDLSRPLHIARLRAASLGWRDRLLSLGGLLPTSHPELEGLIQSAQRKSSLAKRIAFLARTQQIFHLWHVVHRPFSYSFAVLAVIHIAVVSGLGFI
jgi:hypothetical protein